MRKNALFLTFCLSVRISTRSQQYYSR